MPETQDRGGEHCEPDGDRPWEPIDVPRTGRAGDGRLPRHRSQPEDRECHRPEHRHPAPGPRPTRAHRCPAGVDDPSRHDRTRCCHHEGDRREHPGRDADLHTEQEDDSCGEDTWTRGVGQSVCPGSRRGTSRRGGNDRVGPDGIVRRREEVTQDRVHRKCHEDERDDGRVAAEQQGGIEVGPRRCSRRPSTSRVGRSPWPGAALRRGRRRCRTPRFAASGSDLGPQGWIPRRRWERPIVSTAPSTVCGVAASAAAASGSWIGMLVVTAVGPVLNERLLLSGRSLEPAQPGSHRHVPQPTVAPASMKEVWWTSQGGATDSLNWWNRHTNGAARPGFRRNRSATLDPHAGGHGERVRGSDGAAGEALGQGLRDGLAVPAPGGRRLPRGRRRAARGVPRSRLARLEPRWSRSISRASGTCSDIDAIPPRLRDDDHPAEQPTDPAHPRTASPGVKRPAGRSLPGRRRPARERTRAACCCRTATSTSTTTGSSDG